MRSLPAVAVVLLLVTAGCAGLGGSQDSSSTVAPRLDNTPTTTATPAETSAASSSTNASLPPGVTPGADDEVDERALYLAHGRALENTSVTWRRQRLRTNETGTMLGWATRTVWTNGSEQRYEVEAGGHDQAAVQMQGTMADYWTDGTVTVSRMALPNGSVQQEVSEGEPSGTFADVEAGRVVLESILTGTELQYIGVEEQNGTELHVFAGTADDSRLTLRVTSDGIVRSLLYRVETQTDGQEIMVVDRFRTYNIGTTTVDQPEWAANATNQ